jgi:hypothetical protein
MQGDGVLGEGRRRGGNDPWEVDLVSFLRPLEQRLEFFAGEREQLFREAKRVFRVINRHRLNLAASTKRDAGSGLDDSEDAASQKRAHRATNNKAVSTQATIHTATWGSAKHLWDLQTARWRFFQDMGPPNTQRSPSSGSCTTAEPECRRPCD